MPTRAGTVENYGFQKVGERRWKPGERLSTFILTMILRHYYDGPTIIHDRKHSDNYTILKNPWKEMTS